MWLFGSDGRKVVVSQVQLEDGRTVNASKFGSAELDEVVVLELSPEEEEMKKIVADVWASILNTVVEDEVDFFKAGRVAIFFFSSHYPSAFIHSLKSCLIFYFFLTTV